MTVSDVPIAAPRSCPHCGSQSNAGDRFCVACGAELGDLVAAIEPEIGVKSGTGSHASSVGESGPARAPDAAGAPKLSPAGRDCPRCRTVASPDDRFCTGCGARLDEPPVASRSASLGEPTAGSRAALPARPLRAPSPPGQRRPGGGCLLVAALLVLLVLGGPVAWFAWHLWRPSPARLIVWGAPQGLWQVAIEQEGNLRTVDERDLVLPAGTYTIHLTPQGALDERAMPESATFTLEAGRVHVYSAAGEPLEVGAEIGGRWVHTNVGVPAPAPLWLDQQSGSLRWDERTAKAGRWLTPNTEVQVYDAGRAVSADSGRWLAVANPYDEPLQFEVADAQFRWLFHLPACSVRMVPLTGQNSRQRAIGNAVTLPATSRPARGEISIAARVPGEDSAIESVTIPRPPQTALFTVGGATTYEWIGTMGYDAGPAAPVAVLPAQLVRLDDGTVVRFRLPPLSERGSPGKPLLSRETASGAYSDLIAVASGPLVSPPARPLSELTTHPLVRAAVVPQPGDLAGLSIQNLAAGGGGAVVIADGAAFDLASGTRLHTAGPPLRAAAVAAEGLLLITRQGQLASLSDGGLVTGASLGDPTIRVWARPNDAHVLLFGGQSAGGLFTIEGGQVRRLLPADQHVTALGAAPQGIVAAFGRRIERLQLDDFDIDEVPSNGDFARKYRIDVDPDAMRAYGVSIDDVFMAVKMSNIDVGARGVEINKAEYYVRGLGFVKNVKEIEATVVAVNDTVPIYIRDVAHVTLETAVERTTIVELPEGPDVIGLHDTGGLLVFATDEAVYMLSEGAVLPLVWGAGGPIYPHGGDLLMHDQQSRRLLLLKSDLFRAERDD